MDAKELAQRLPDGHARIERRGRILQHDLDPPARRGDPPHGQRGVGETNLARSRAVETDDAAAEHRLAAARLADKAERLNLEVDAIDRAKRRRRPPGEAAPEPASHTEVHRQPADLEQRLVRHRRAPAPAGRRARSRRSRRRGYKRLPVAVEALERKLAEGGNRQPSADEAPPCHRRSYD
jgi:hypothetical protein